MAQTATLVNATNTDSSKDVGPEFHRPIISGKFGPQSGHGAQGLERKIFILKRMQSSRFVPGSEV